MPAAWDQLLDTLSLNDEQALEAIKAGGESGERLRKFISCAYRLHFVPEAAIEAMRRRAAKRHCSAVADQSMA